MRIDPKIKLIIWEMYDVSLSLSRYLSLYSFKMREAQIKFIGSQRVVRDPSLCILTRQKSKTVQPTV